MLFFLFYVSVQLIRNMGNTKIRIICHPHFDPHSVCEVPSLMNGVIISLQVVAKYYLPTRYPDASFCYVRKCPYEAYSLDEAKEALVAAERVLELIKVFTAYQP